MSKYIFLFILFFSFSNAETIFNGKCVDNFFINKNNILVIEYSDNTKSKEFSSQYTIDSLVNNIGLFYYDSSTSKCLLATSKYFGLTEIQFNFMSALTGLLTAFLIVSAIQKRV